MISFFPMGSFFSSSLSKENRLSSPAIRLLEGSSLIFLPYLKIHQTATALNTTKIATRTPMPE